MIESSAAMRRPISLLSFACLVLMTAPALRTDATPTEGRPPSVPEPPAPQRLVAERLCWRTADADYPRVRLHPQRTAPGWLHLEVCFGRYAASDAALTNRPVKVRHRDIAAGDRPCQVGLPRAELLSVSDLFRRRGIVCLVGARESGSGSTYLREDLLTCNLTEANRDAGFAILREKVLARLKRIRRFILEPFASPAAGGPVSERQ